MDRMRLFCAALLGVAITVSVMPAMAAEPPTPSVTETAAQFDQAVEGIGAASAAPNPDVDLPDDGQRKAVLETDAGRVVMKLPVTEHLDDDGQTRVFDGRGSAGGGAVGVEGESQDKNLGGEGCGQVAHRFQTDLRQDEGTMNRKIKPCLAWQAA